MIEWWLCVAFVSIHVIACILTRHETTRKFGDEQNPITKKLLLSATRFWVFQICMMLAAVITILVLLPVDVFWATLLAIIIVIAWGIDLVSDVYQSIQLRRNAWRIAIQQFISVGQLPSNYHGHFFTDYFLGVNIYDPEV